MTTEEHVATGEHAHPGPAEYVKVALVLSVVTTIEVAAYYVTALPRPVFSAALLIMMVVKFSLVGLWFMHLRFDSRTYARFFVMGLAGAVTLYVVVLLSFGVFGR